MRKKLYLTTVVFLLLYQERNRNCLFIFWVLLHWLYLHLPVGTKNSYHNFICYFLKRPASAMLNSNEFGPVVGWKKNSNWVPSNIKFYSVALKITRGSLLCWQKTIWNARKQPQLKQQAMNSVRHDKSSPFEFSTLLLLGTARPVVACTHAKLIQPTKLSGFKHCATVIITTKN